MKKDSFTVKTPPDSAQMKGDHKKDAPDTKAKGPTADFLATRRAEIGKKETARGKR